MLAVEVHYQEMEYIVQVQLWSWSTMVQRTMTVRPALA